MTREALQTYLHREIPLTVAMGLAVHEASPSRVILTAPLGPNANHQGTAFGGSLAAIATLAAWSLLWLRCRNCEEPPDLVIRRSEMEYLRPITDTLTAVCEFDDEPLWTKALERLRRRGRTRIDLASRLDTDEGPGVRFYGRFALSARARGC